MKQEIVKYNISTISNIDQEVRDLISLFHEAKIKVGMALSERLVKIEENKLYLKIDEKAYPSFIKYIDSLGINYKTARELMGLYQSYVIAGRYSIDEILEISYAKLQVLKPYLFKKVDGKYELDKSKKEVDNLIKELKADTSIDDIKQLRRDKEIGKHACDWYRVSNDICEICKAKEFAGKKKISK